MELVEPLAHAAKLREHRRAMRGGGAEPVVAGELREHLARPARAVLEWRRHARGAGERLEDVGHVPVFPRERREVRHAEAENRAHGRGFSDPQDPVSSRDKLIAYFLSLRTTADCVRPVWRAISYVERHDRAKCESIWRSSFSTRAR